MDQYQALASILIPLPKDSVTPGICPPKDRIRPVAVGEVFYRLAAQRALCNCGSLSSLFPEVQRGFHKGSVEWSSTQSMRHTWNLLNIYSTGEISWYLCRLCSRIPTSQVSAQVALILIPLPQYRNFIFWQD
jgi:hypothetical protein